MKVTFTGEFKDLIPMGFKFHKLYARNYRVYEKNDLWIWVMGREVNLKDLHGNSGSIIKLILDGKYPLYKKEVNFFGKTWFKKGEPKNCVMEYTTGKLIPSLDFIKKYGTALQVSPRYRELIIPLRVYNQVLEMRNLLKLEE